MIITEQFEDNGRLFIKTYSDTDKYVVRDGISYIEAIDPDEYGRTYTEGENIEEPSTTADDALNIILGETP